MKELSLITHYYNGHDRAQALLDHLAIYPAETFPNWEIIIVDDCSTEEKPLIKHSLNVRHLRVVTNINWNQTGARNLGAMLAAGQWGLFFDIDQQIYYTGINYLLSNIHRLQYNTMYYMKVDNFIDSTINEPLNIHPNTFLVNLPQFRSNGMYDEDFAGNYGYEDLYLPYLWEKNGGVRGILGEGSFFKDIKFRTANLERSLEVNKLKSTQKLLEGIKRPKNIIRFEWKEIE